VTKSKHSASGVIRARSERGRGTVEELHNENQKEAHQEETHHAVEEHARQDVREAHDHGGLEVVLAVHVGGVRPSVRHFGRPATALRVHPEVFLYSSVAVVPVHD